MHLAKIVGDLDRVKAATEVFCEGCGAHIVDQRVRESNWSRVDEDQHRQGGNDHAAYGAEIERDHLAVGTFGGAKKELGGRSCL